MRRGVTGLVVALALSAMAGGASAQIVDRIADRDCPTCPEMVAVPAGSFTMGVALAEEDREAVQPAERGLAVPQRRVAIGRSFSLGRHEVTRAQFAAFVQATSYVAGSACSIINSSGEYVETKGRDWRNPGYSQADNHPVVCVNWNDAKAYVDWLARTTGKAYRLPSEAEWEYAARAGSTTARPWGDGRDGACVHANVADRSIAGPYNQETFACADGHVQTAPVGSLRANAFGLYDMLGNAWEWTADCWTANYNGAPTDGSARMTGDCSRHAVRGGGWLTHPRLLRSGNRYGDLTVERSSDTGFRVARTD